MWGMQFCFESVSKLGYLTPPPQNNNKGIDVAFGIPYGVPSQETQSLQHQKGVPSLMI